MNAATADGGTRLPADGNQVPVLGLGVWQVPDGRDCVNAGRWAVETGYRHADAALDASTGAAALVSAARTHRHGQVNAPRAHPPDAQICYFALSVGDMAKLDALDQIGGTARAPSKPRGGRS